MLVFWVCRLSLAENIYDGGARVRACPCRARRVVHRNDALKTNHSIRMEDRLRAGRRSDSYIPQVRTSFGMETWNSLVSQSHPRIIQSRRNSRCHLNSAMQRYCSPLPPLPVSLGRPSQDQTSKAHLLETSPLWGAGSASSAKALRAGGTLALLHPAIKVQPSSGTTPRRKSILPPPSHMPAVRRAFSVVRTNAPHNTCAHEDVHHSLNPLSLGHATHSLTKATIKTT